VLVTYLCGRMRRLKDFHFDELPEQVPMVEPVDQAINTVAFRHAIV
jgi:hypothetical protein